MWLLAGHVWGDPCEFGVVSVLNTAWSQPAADKYGGQHAQEARLGQGLSASFVWLAAQAHNQGQGQLSGVPLCVAWPDLRAKMRRAVVVVLVLFICSLLCMPQCVCVCA